MSSPKLFLSKPSIDLFQLPPSYEPEVLLPPNSFTAPYHIPAELYNRALDTIVPIFIATIYFILVFFLNIINQRRQNKPWAISNTRIFATFVILHNTFLALYSGWTFHGMWGTLKRSVVSPYGQNGYVGTVDSLCKIHGPQGLGESILYNTTLSKWLSHSPSLALGANGSPGLGDSGRIWNEGLAYFGWLFYLSKFYEVLDTFIILAKGKNSGFLQTYHHTGAMLCMWAGIRFMSPPIWMFVFINSGIHTFMYTYFTITSLKFRVPQAIKKILTSLQITQLAVGTFYAAIHSFISYSYLSEIPFLETIPQSSSTMASTIGTASSSAPTPILERIKMLLISSLGGSNFARPEPEVVKYTNRVGFHKQEITIHCLDTSGQNFAVWLNVLYLIPLTFLFVRFFVNSYFERSPKSTRDKNNIPADETPLLVDQVLRNEKEELTR